MPTLMSALLLVPEISTLNHTDLINHIMSESPYNTNIFPVLNEAAWTDEISCLHNWHVLNNELNELYAKREISVRLSYLRDKIVKASNIYKRIGEVMPLLDTKSNSTHLNIWNTAIESFKNEMGI